MKNITFEQFNSAVFKLFDGNPVLKNPLNSFVIADPSVLTPDVSHDGKWHLFCHTFFGVYRYESADGINFKNTGKIVNRAMRPNINYIDGKYYLFLDGLDPSGFIPLDEYSFIVEYGSSENVESLRGFLSEHGRAICQENAVERLGIL